ncbi:hypothetical protein B0H19DRAFT_1078775 [Mycena capillaripes]|nr:hypothetical protein B0H19DRAFT_1078775 [Mycena capillaripes]
MHYLFTFGPNGSYFLSAGTYFVHSKDSLPGPVNDLVVELDRRLLNDSKATQLLKMPWDVAFPMEEGLYTMLWTQSDGGWFRDANLGPNYTGTRLARFINNAMATGKYALPLDVATGYSWQNLPSELEDEIRNDILTRRPYLALNPSVAGQYWALFCDGSTLWDLRPGGANPEPAEKDNGEESAGGTTQNHRVNWREHIHWKESLEMGMATTERFNKGAEFGQNLGTLFGQ